MAEGIAYAILEKIGEYLVAPVGRQFKYLFHYNKNIENLRAQVKNLEDMRDGVQLLIVAARNNLQVIAPEVEAWMTNVEKIKIESYGIFKDTAAHNAWCQNLKSRYVLSRKAMKKAQIAVELRDEGKGYTKFSYPAPIVTSGMPAATSTPNDSTHFQSRMSTAKQIMHALENEDIGMIGICGMGGVGKTTMVEDVAQRLRSQKIFDEVAIAVVSQNQDFIKIQGQLSEMLGLKLEEETSIPARAHRLRARLTSGKRILVILDDVWRGIDLAKIGIPFGDDRKGCKVVLTSRDEQVCTDMRSDKNFTIEVLSEREAWNLFKEMAGECVDTAEIKQVAEEVAKECGGLPLAIVTVGNALRNKNLCDWDDALHQLRKSSVTNIYGVNEIVFSRIELSYNYLQSDQAKSMLLLCCVFQEDENIPIEMLVKYGVGLQLFEDVDTMEHARNRASSIIGVLIRSYLLLGDDENAYVKMHDVVRDVGLKIAKDEHGYMVRHAVGLKDWPQMDTQKPCTAISISFEEMEPFADGFSCPQLKLLKIKTTFYCWQIKSREFFKEMKELRVLHFEGLECYELLPSIQFLMKLRTLCLHKGRLYGNLSMIGSLQNLEVLSFFDTHLDTVPSEIGQLTNLKVLDLRCYFHAHCRYEGPRRIPCGTLSCLKKLEELCMGHFFARANEGNCATITELYSLSRLNTLQISIPPNPEFLLTLKNFHYEKLKRFDFSMTCGNVSNILWVNKVFLVGVDLIMISETNIIVLVRRTEELALEKVRDLKNVVKDLNKEGFVNLKTLEICDCVEVEIFINAMDSVSNSAFSRLQELHLKQLPKLSHLLKGPIQSPCLSNLRKLDLSSCHEMKSLFPWYMVKCLVQLQHVEVTRCKMLEGIVSEEGAECKRGPEEKIEFPKLRELKISYLQMFRSFYIAVTEGNQQVSLPNLEKLNLEWMFELRHIVGDTFQAGLLHNLRRIFLIKCFKLEVVFDLERLNAQGEHEEVVLGELESIYLETLPMLTDIWRIVPGIQGFYKLTSLEVNRCWGLRYLLSPLTAKMLVNLQVLKLEKCKMMEEIIMVQEEDDSQIQMMVEIVFPQLRHVSLYDLENLTTFCSTKHNLKFPLLEKVLISRCPNMETFCSGPLTTPKVERVYLDMNWRDEINLDKWVWKGDLNSTISFLKETNV